MGYQVTTEPAAEPCTAAEVKLSARLTATGLDTLITSDYIPAARRACEHRTGRSLITQTLRKTIDDFPSTDDIELAYGPVQSITSVKYLDADGVEQTVDSDVYTLDNRDPARSAWVILQDGESWPDAGDYANAVYVTYVAGYGDASTDIPQELRLWVIGAAAEMVRSGVLSIPRDFAGGMLDRDSAVAY